MSKYKTPEEFWEGIKVYGVGTNQRWADSVDEISPINKALNKVYARDILGLDPENGLIAYYRNSVNRHNNLASAAAGYLSLDSRMAWDYNSHLSKYPKDRTPFDGRYKVKVKPSEVTGLIGFSNVQDEYGVVVGPDVTSIPDRAERVGDLEIQKPTDWIDDSNTFDRSTGGTPWRNFSTLSNFDYYPLEFDPLPGKSFSDFRTGLGLPDDAIAKKYQELYGTDVNEALDKAGMKGGLYQGLQSMFIKFKGQDGKDYWGLDPRVLDLKYRYRGGGNIEVAEGDAYDVAIKVLSTIQELIGKPFMVNRGHDMSDSRLVEAPKVSPTVEPTVEEKDSTEVSVDTPTARPYELQEQKKRNLGWGNHEHRGKFTGYNSYDQSTYFTNGPTNGILIAVSNDRTDADARTNTALDLAAGEKGMKGVVDVQNEIVNDPNYPTISDEELWDAMKDVPWVKDRGLTSMDEVRAQTSMGEAYSKTMSKWEADGRIADVEAYLKKENAFVVNKLENMVMASGQRVGDVLDSIAKDSILELGQISTDEEVSLFMPSGRLKKFITEGRFKTVYETTRNNKGGTREVYMFARESSEYQMGVPEDTKDADRPVYGIVGSGNYSGQYGNTKVIFKDAIKGRTTVTVGDSIDGGPGAYWMSDLSENKYTLADFWKKTGGNVLFSSQNENSPVFERGTVAGSRNDSYVKGYQKTPVRNLAWGANGYIESQIHGGVTLADVAKIVIPAPNALPVATKKMLEDMGIVIEIDSSLKSEDN